MYELGSVLSLLGIIFCSISFIFCTHQEKREIEKKIKIERHQHAYEKDRLLEQHEKEIQEIIEIRDKCHAMDHEELDSILDLQEYRMHKAWHEERNEKAANL